MQPKDEHSLPRILSQREAPNDDGTGGAGRRPAAPLRCKVKDCDANLESAPKTHQRFRLCNNHIKAPVISVDGVAQRFCQQCSRFHPLSEFDGLNRTCRMMLAKNRARQRNHSQRQAPLQGIMPFQLTGSTGLQAPWEQHADLRMPGGSGGFGSMGMGITAPGSCGVGPILSGGPGGRYPSSIGWEVPGGAYGNFHGNQGMSAPPVQGSEGWLSAPLRLNNSAVAVAAGQTGSRALHPGLMLPEAAAGSFQQPAPINTLLQMQLADPCARVAAARQSTSACGRGGAAAAAAAIENSQRSGDHSSRQWMRRSSAKRRDGGGGGGGDADCDGYSSEESSSGSSDELIKVAAAAGVTANQLQPKEIAAVDMSMLGFLSVGASPQKVSMLDGRQDMDLGMHPAVDPGAGFGGLSGHDTGATRPQQAADPTPSITAAAAMRTAATGTAIAAAATPSGAAAGAGGVAAPPPPAAAAAAGWDTSPQMVISFPEERANSERLAQRGPPTPRSVLLKEAPAAAAGHSEARTPELPMEGPLPPFMGVAAMGDGGSIRPRSHSSTGISPSGLLLMHAVHSSPAATGRGTFRTASGGDPPPELQSSSGVGGSGGSGGGASKRRRHRGTATVTALQPQEDNLQCQPQTAGSPFHMSPQQVQLQEHQRQQQQLLLMQRQLEEMRQQLDMQQCDTFHHSLHFGVGSAGAPPPHPQLEVLNAGRDLMSFGSAPVAAVAEDHGGRSEGSGPPHGGAMAIDSRAATAEGNITGAGGAVGDGMPPAVQSAAGPIVSRGAGSSMAMREISCPALVQRPERTLVVPTIDVFEHLDDVVDVDALMTAEEGIGMSDSGGMPTVAVVGLGLGMTEGLASSSDGALGGNELAALAAEWSQEAADCPGDTTVVAPLQPPSLQLGMLSSQLPPPPATPAAADATLSLLSQPPAQRPSFPGAAANLASVPPAFNRVSDESSLIASGAACFRSGQYVAEAAAGMRAAAAASVLPCGVDSGLDIGLPPPFLGTLMWSPVKHHQSQRRHQAQSILTSSIASQGSGSGAGEVMSRPSDALTVSPMVISSDLAAGGGGGNRGGGGRGRGGAREGGKTGTFAGVAIPAGLADAWAMLGATTTRFQPRAMQQPQQQQQQLLLHQEQQQEHLAEGAFGSVYINPALFYGTVATAAPPTDLAVGSGTLPISAQEQLQELQQQVQEMQLQLQQHLQQLQLQQQLLQEQLQQQCGQPHQQLPESLDSVARDMASPRPLPPPPSQQQRQWYYDPHVQLGTEQAVAAAAADRISIETSPVRRKNPDLNLSPFPEAAVVPRRQPTAPQLQSLLTLTGAAAASAAFEDEYYFTRPLLRSPFTTAAFTVSGAGATAGSVACNQAVTQVDFSGSGRGGVGSSQLLAGHGRGSARSFTWAQPLPLPPVPMFGPDDAAFIAPMRGGSSAAAAVSSSTETSGGDHRSTTNALHRAISGCVSSDNSSRGSGLAATRGGQQQQHNDVTDAAAWALQQQLMLQSSEPPRQILFPAQRSQRPSAPTPTDAATLISGPLASSPAIGLLHGQGLPFLAAVTARQAATIVAASSDCVYGLATAPGAAGICLTQLQQGVSMSLEPLGLPTGTGAEEAPSATITEPANPPMVTGAAGRTAGVG